MSHPPDDKLLELVLDLLDESEVQTLREHLSECADCQARFARIHSRTEVLGSVSPAGRPPAYPGRRSRPRVLPSILKAAALLLLGFCGGFATGEYVRPESVNVVPSSFEGRAGLEARLENRYLRAFPESPILRSVT
jgi:anti-sigma factor RsiW